MKSVKVSYSISEESKNRAADLKKAHGINLSEFIDTILKFDGNSLEKLFELFKLSNKDKIKEWNRIDTKQGSFVWGENILRNLSIMPLDSYDTEEVASSTIEVESFRKSKKEKEILAEHKKLMTVVAHHVGEIKKLQKKVELLEEKIN